MSNPQQAGLPAPVKKPGMKRSEKIALGAVGLIAVAAFWPFGGSNTAAPDTENVVAYKSREDCAKAGDMTSAQCDAEFGKAEAAAISSAPKHTSQAACEAQYGMANCRQTQWGGASVFVPLMTGILVANYLNNSTRAAQPVYPGQGFARTDCAADPALARARPECAQRQASTASRSSSGSWNFSTPHGSTHTADASTASKGMAMSSSAVSGRSSTGVSSRGGFGSSSSSFSSSGS